MYIHPLLTSALNGGERSTSYIGFLTQETTPVLKEQKVVWVPTLISTRDKPHDTGEIRNPQRPTTSVVTIQTEQAMKAQSGSRGIVLLFL